jgi:hypothetical protein
MVPLIVDPKAQELTSLKLRLQKEVSATFYLQTLRIKNKKSENVVEVVQAKI